MSPLERNHFRDADDFRRDRDLGHSVPAELIAEFDNSDDALAFLAYKGAAFTLTPGITHRFGVRRLAVLSKQAG
jgi:hypothetical protein